jgi:hypothetical protein
LNYARVRLPLISRDRAIRQASFPIDSRRSRLCLEVGTVNVRRG